MKRSLLFTLLALLFVSNSVFAQFTQSGMVKEWQRAETYTIAYLDTMPEDGYSFKPTPEIRSFVEQMLHLAWTNYFLASLASGKPDPYEKIDYRDIAPHTKEATTRAVTDSYNFVISTLQAMTSGQLQETIKFAKQDITRFGMFGKAFEHQTHHRGQTTIYLRLKGLTPPHEMLF